mgnify:FL=1
MDATVDYLLENKKSFILSLSDNSCNAETELNKLNDASVLSDLETGSRSHSILLSHSTTSILSPLFISHHFPCFTHLQRVSLVHSDGIQRSSSLYGIICSISDLSVSFSPLLQTGVITHIAGNRVRVSILNCESGLAMETDVDEDQVGVQKSRLFFHLDDVRQSRGNVGILGMSLFQYLLREFCVCLLGVGITKFDTISVWQLNPYNLVKLTKYLYFSSCHEKEHDSGVEVYGYHSTIFEAWLTQLKETVRLSAHGSELIQSFMDRTWDQSDKNVVNLFATEGEKEELTSISHFHSLSGLSSRSLVSEGGEKSVSSLNMNSRLDEGCVVVSSLHPSFPKTRYTDVVSVRGVAGLRVLFDPRCCLDSNSASLSFFTDEDLRESIARFTGKGCEWSAFSVKGDTLRFVYESDLNASEQWGYAFIVQPFQNVFWEKEKSVLGEVCFEWNCESYAILLSMCDVWEYKRDDFFNRTLVNLVEYLRTSGMPFKSRVVTLLMRLMMSDGIEVQVWPDVR